MKSYSLSHLADQTLLHDLAALAARDRATTAAMLAYLAEVDARRLYLPAACPSMYCYCVRELGLSEDSACKRIRAARTARQFPPIFPALAEGRLSLSAVVGLAPYLTRENADELLEAAAHKSKSEIEKLIAERFPRPEVLALVETVSIPPPGQHAELSPGTAGQPAPPRIGAGSRQPATGPTELSAPGRMSVHDRRPQTMPLAPRRFALQLTMSQELYDKLRYAHELLSHTIPAGDVAQVVERALDVLIPTLEQRKFAASTRPRPSDRPSARPRHIPAHVRRAVWERDRGQCTFVSEPGRRCPARTFLEFDHADPVARGGQATIGGVRLRCRAHNQFGAERVFGGEFMRRKREEARRARVAERDQVEARRKAREKVEEVIPWLRALGVRAEEARRAATLCEKIPEASLEHRVRTALRSLAPSSASRRVAPV